MTEMKWYAVYTNINAEKKLYSRLSALTEHYNIEAYLPLLKQTKQWSDRRKITEVPLFKSYVFVRADTHAYHKVKEINGFLHYVKLGRQACVIPDEDIQKVKKILGHQAQLAVNVSPLKAGQKVKIKEGCMKDYQGVLVQDQGASKVLIKIRGIDQNLEVSVATDLLQPMYEEDE